MTDDDRLPVIDVHRVHIAAAPELVWEALGTVLPMGEGRLSRAVGLLLGLHPADRRGDPLTIGSTAPGFAVVRADVPTQLLLQGRHRFSRYALAFSLHRAAGGTAVLAETRPSFPGRGSGIRGPRAHRAPTGRSTVSAVPGMPQAVAELAERLTEFGWVSDLLVGGSLAMNDYVPGVSDLDLVAIVDGTVDPGRLTTLTTLHRRLDAGCAAGTNLGCVYVSGAQVLHLQVCHPTWTHQRMVQRVLSGLSRAELVRHGFAVFGRPPVQILGQVTHEQVREATRAELLGYWQWASRRPWMWLDPVIADLGLTSMARGRHTLQTGELLTKSAAVEKADVPAWLVDQLRARRQGQVVPSPRLRTAALAWRDARRTVARARTPL